MKNKIINHNYLLLQRLSTFNLITLTVFVIYFLSIILTPFIRNIKICNYANDIFYKSSNVALISKLSKVKSNCIIIKIINAVSYINDEKMLLRQIDNNNTQEFISDAKGSVLKFNDVNKSVNNRTYFFDAYGNAITKANRINLTNQRNHATKDFNKYDETSKIILSEHDIVAGSCENISMHSINPLSSRNSVNKCANHELLALSHSILITIDNSFQYNGERFDINTRLQYLRARFYNPLIKRFITQDPYQLLNKFGYGNANPTMYSDPAGHDVFNNFKNFFENVDNDAMVGIGILELAFLGGFAYCMKKYNYFVIRRNEETVNPIKRNTIISDESITVINKSGINEAETIPIQRELLDSQIECPENYMQHFIDELKYILIVDKQLQEKKILTVIFICTSSHMNLIMRKCIKALVLLNLIACQVKKL